MPKFTTGLFGATYCLCDRRRVCAGLIGIEIDAPALDQITLVNDFVATDVLSSAITQITVPV